MLLFSKGGFPFSCVEHNKFPCFAYSSAHFGERKGSLFNGIGLLGGFEERTQSITS